MSRATGVAMSGSASIGNSSDADSHDQTHNDFQSHNNLDNVDLNV